MGTLRDVFRRTTKQPPAPAPQPDAKLGGKGRPTPTRREAEQAAKERARLGMDSKQAKKVMQERRSANAARVRQGMKNGDERYLMQRDKGPVRHFIRDFVDRRRTFSEFLLPMLVIITVMTFTHNTTLVNYGQGIWAATVLLLVLDLVLLNLRLSKELHRRFAGTGQSINGWRRYAFMRSIQMRVMRMPKPQVKVGQELPKTYR